MTSVKICYNRIILMFKINTIKIITHNRIYNTYSDIKYLYLKNNKFYYVLHRFYDKRKMRN